jgi:hypothetical protein
MQDYFLYIEVNIMPIYSSTFWVFNPNCYAVSQNKIATSLEECNTMPVSIRQTSAWLVFLCRKHRISKCNFVYKTYEVFFSHKIVHWNHLENFSSTVFCARKPFPRLADMF